MPVLPRTLEIQSEIAAIRRDIHAHPELAYEENRTSDIVAAKLQEWGLEVTRGLGKTRIVIVRHALLTGQIFLGMKALQRRLRDDLTCHANGIGGDAAIFVFRQIVRLDHRRGRRVR